MQETIPSTAVDGNSSTSQHLYHSTLSQRISWCRFPQQHIATSTYLSIPASIRSCLELSQCPRQQARTLRISSWMTDSSLTASQCSSLPKMVLNSSSNSLPRCAPSSLLNSRQKHYIIHRQTTKPRNSIRSSSCASDTMAPNIIRIRIPLSKDSRMYTTQTRRSTKPDIV